MGGGHIWVSRPPSGLAFTQGSIKMAFRAWCSVWDQEECDKFGPEPYCKPPYNCEGCTRYITLGTVAFDKASQRDKTFGRPACRTRATSTKCGSIRDCQRHCKDRTTKEDK